jgi:hypothetical protein
MPRGRVSQTAVDRSGKTGAPQTRAPAMPLFHLGGRSVVRIHYRASNSESFERIERPGAI